jgi:hypothetical protein
MGNVYSFLDTQAAINGPGGSFPIGGSGSGAADEGISVEMAEDKSTLTIGADGSGMHSLHASKAGKITIRLLKTSPVNARLSALYALQTVSSALHGQNVITIKNPTLGDSITGVGCAFKKFPSVSYGKDGPMNVWEFDVAQLDMALGGGGNLANIVSALTSNIPTGSV